MPNRKSSRGGSRAVPVVLATAAAIGTLMYLFLLLVPHWRLVMVDRDLLYQRLQGSSSSSSSNNSSSSSSSSSSRQKALDWLENGVQLRSRSANLFRECLWDSADNDTMLLDMPDVGNSLVTTKTTAATTTRSPASAVTKAAERLESAVSSLSTESSVSTDATTPQPSSDSRTTSSSSGYTTSAPDSGKERRELEDRCWLVDLRWAEGISNLPSGQRSLLRCLRAMFALSLLLLCCKFTTLVAALYACFSSAVSRSSSCMLMIFHCLCLALLVSMVILQDASRGLEDERLKWQVRTLFPPNSEQAISVTTGACSLVLLCILMCLSIGQLVLLLFNSRAVPSRDSSAAKSSNEGDEDSNPLIM